MHTRARPTTATSRRAFLGLGALGLSVPILSSCAGGVTGGNGGGNELDQVDMNVPSEYAGREMNLAMWSAMGGNNGEVLNELIEKFNQSQDDIYVEVQFQGPYEESSSQLSAALQAGHGPDIMMLSDTFWSRFLLNDVLEPLDDYFTEDFNRSHYVEQLFDEGIANGQTFWISYGRSTPLFYYNKEIFDEAGLPDRGPETWTELREWAAELSRVEAAGQSVATHAFTSGDDWPFMAAAWQFGGSISEGLDITIDQAEAVEAGRWQQRFIFEDGYGYLAQDPVTDFSAGVVATTVASTATLGGIYASADFEVGAAFLPRQVTHGVPTGGMGFSLLKDTPQERKDAAFEVLKFLGRPDNAAEWTLGTGYMPIVKASVDEPELAQTLAEDPNFSVAVDQLELSAPSDAVRSLVYDSTSVIMSGLQEIFSSGSADVQTTFDGVAAQLRDGVEAIRDDYERWYGRQ